MSQISYVIFARHVRKKSNRLHGKGLGLQLMHTYIGTWQEFLPKSRYT